MEQLNASVVNLSREQPANVPHDTGVGRRVPRMDEHDIGSE